MNKRTGVGDVTDVTKPTNAKDIAAALAGRVPMHLMPMSATIAGNMAFLEGALKYGAYNWRVGGVQATVYISALDRHLKAWFNGQDLDPDSGLNHLWKALACIAILIDAIEVGCLKDDRPVHGAEARMLDELKALVQEVVARYPNPVPPYLAIDADVEEGSR